MRIYKKILKAQINISNTVEKGLFVLCKLV